MIHKLILGTVQFGMKYGINNSLGQPKQEEVHNILNAAYEAGISFLDTASAYGNAEELIGNFHLKNKAKRFKIITKFHCHVKEEATSIISSALERVEVEHIDIFLFHSFDEYLNKPELIKTLKEKREKGLIGKIGVSIYSNEEIEQVLSDRDIEVIQVPFNLLDNENQRGDILRKAKDHGKTIHTRSTFLQGLFFKSTNELPFYFNPIKSGLEKIKSIAQSSKISLPELALGYALSKYYIDGVLIGVDSVGQLNSNIKAAEKSLPEEVILAVDEILISDQSLLHPSNWKK